ncbi:MAG: hypothetical protein ACI4HI_16115 [Lachnospiraceae bacterium]
MDMTIKMSVVSDSQILINGLRVLNENLGVVNTLKFLEQFDNGGNGDFTKEKYEQDDEPLSVEEILKMFQSSAH